MALTKRTYTDGETIITAQNLNAIQDEIISQGNNKANKSATVSNIVYNNNSNHKLQKTINGTTTDVFTVETTPTANSVNPVSSGAAKIIKDSLENIDFANAISVSTTNQDLNTYYTKGGVWYFPSSYSPTNKPADSGNYGFLVVMRSASNARVAQFWIVTDASTNAVYFRSNSTSNISWSAWTKVASASDLSSLSDTVATKLPTSSLSDANISTLGSILAPINSSASNLPSGVSHYCSIWHYASSSSNATQILQEAGANGSIWIRKKVSGTWGDWVKFITSTATTTTATLVSTLPSGVTSAEIKYVKCGQMVTIYGYIVRNSTAIASYVTIATSLPLPASVPTVNGGNNCPLINATVAGTHTGRPLAVYVNSSGDLRVNRGETEGSYYFTCSYITKDV